MTRSNTGVLQQSATPPIQNQGMVTILNVVINTKRQVLILEITKKITFSIVLQ